MNNLTVNSILIVQYLSMYSKLEKIIKQIFQSKIETIDHAHKNKLYFMRGCNLSTNVIYNYEESHFYLNGSKKTWGFDDSEKFGFLDFNKIVRFDECEHLIVEFNIDIKSIQHKNTFFTLHDMCRRIISTRNKLAHEYDHLSFGNKEIIEILSHEILEGWRTKYQWLSEYEIKEDNDIAQALFSNYIYMTILLDMMKASSNV